MTFTLYPAADCGGTILYRKTVGDVSGSGGYTTPKWFRIRQAGTYYWVASSSGDSSNDAFASGCNDAPVRLESTR
jgi:hypothetical protein